MSGAQDDRSMESATALFPELLGQAAWRHLPEPLRRMHGAESRVLARGSADVEGSTHPLARRLRRSLGLPEPGTQQPLEFSIQRDAGREIWTRRFANGQMRSVLDRRAGSPYLRECLGPATFDFMLHHQGHAIDWDLRRVKVYGLRLPRSWFGHVLSRSGATDNRYTFDIDTRLPLIGQLIAYRGWLEHVPSA
jgi:hypothetical protein